jgi:type IV pilus assembly protein PilE
MRNKLAGFTLIEKMIVVVIIAVQAAIAIPNYQDYLARSRRAECQTVMVSLANALERRYSTTNTYLGGAEINNFRCPADGGPANYNLAFQAGSLTATTFVIVATRAGAQSGDQCGDLTLASTGLKGIVNAAAGRTAAQCW